MRPEDIEFVASMARARAGLMLRGERSFFVENRLASIARREGAASVEALVQRLKARDDEALAVAVVEALATPETSFFRDRRAFERLREEILPDLAAARGGEPVRVWCAGCSTGQEVYSLAMLEEDLRAQVPGLTLDILATDLSERALEKARTGLYTQFEVQRGLPIRLLLRHFERAGDNWRVSPRLRPTTRWAKLNLMDDLSAQGPFELILCRNVLSYFDIGPRRHVLEGLARALAPNGRLMLGAAEAAELPEAFEPAGAGLHRRNPAFGLAAA